MTPDLRDHFAGLAMQGILVHSDAHRVEYVAERAYHVADAMLAIRATPRPTRYGTTMLPPPIEEPPEPPAPHSDTDPTAGVLEAFSRLSPEQRRNVVKDAGGMPTYEKPEELRWAEKRVVANGTTKEGGEHD
jgi:hypothetical protein